MSELTTVLVELGQWQGSSPGIGTVAPNLPELRGTRASLGKIRAGMVPLRREQEGLGW